MSASLILARTEALALIWWDITSAPALLAHLVFCVRSMKMTVLHLRGCAILLLSASTMAPVWTGWVDTAAIVPLDSQEKDVRET